MDSLELLYDHYKDSFSLISEAQIHRNKFFLAVSILEALSLLLVTFRNSTVAFIQDVIKSEVETDIIIGSSIICTTLWVLLLYFIVRYIQNVIYIERQYKYIEKIEKEISSRANFSFCRETANYLNNYPKVLNFIDFIYKWFLPLLFLLINSIHIVLEWKTYSRCRTILIDTITFLMVTMLTVLYLFKIHQKERN